MIESVKRILVVDDQLLYLKSLELALKNDYEVTLSTQYTEAIQLLQESHFDIVLTDIRLDEDDDSNMDGIKILEWIRMNKVETSPFVMSAYTKFDYAEQSLNLGAKHFFKKPIDIISLKAILKEKF